MRGEAPPGVGLHVHLLQWVGAPAAGLASRLRHRAAGASACHCQPRAYYVDSRRVTGRRRPPGGAAGHRALWPGCCRRPPGGPRSSAAWLTRAMVYRADDVRHPVPLRWGWQAPTGGGVDANVLQPFSTPTVSSPRRPRRVTRAGPPAPLQPDTEQPGCPYAKHGSQSGVAVGLRSSTPELLFVSLSWPRSPRELDMRASPQSTCTRYGLDPIRIGGTIRPGGIRAVPGRDRSARSAGGWRCCPDASGCWPTTARRWRVLNLRQMKWIVEGGQI